MASTTSQQYLTRSSTARQNISGQSIPSHVTFVYCQPILYLVPRRERERKREHGYILPTQPDPTGFSQLVDVTLRAGSGDKTTLISSEQALHEIQHPISRPFGQGNLYYYYLQCGGLQWGTPLSTWPGPLQTNTNYKTQSPDEPQTKKHTKTEPSSLLQCLPPSYNNIIISTEGTCSKHTHRIHQKMHIFAQFLLSPISISISLPPPPLPLSFTSMCTQHSN